MQQIIKKITSFLGNIFRQVKLGCKQALSEGEKKFGERSEWDAGEPVDIVFDALFHPLVISLLQK